MEKIVVYYSMSENTDHVAKRIAEETGADLLRIYPVKAYPDKGFQKFYRCGKSAVMAEKPKLLPYDADLGRYETVVFGTPVWASSPAPPLRSFIRDNREALKGKKFAAYACYAGSGADKAIMKLKKLLGVKEMIAEASFLDPKERQDSEESILSFCRQLKESGKAE